MRFPVSRALHRKPLTDSEEEYRETLLLLHGGLLWSSCGCCWLLVSDGRWQLDTFFYFMTPQTRRQIVDDYSALQKVHSSLFIRLFVSCLCIEIELENFKLERCLCVD